LDLFVARQPIFDLSGELSGYELLYRSSASSRCADGVTTFQMGVDVVVHSFLEVGLQRITHGRTGFLNFSGDMLIQGAYELLDRDGVVIEILEDAVVDPELRAVCERMVEAGYRLALDDFEWGSSHESLLDLVEIVKVNVLHRSEAEVASITEPLRGRGVTLLAERVETPEVHEWCERLGFELFQGYHYSRPEMVAHRGMAVSPLAILQMVNLLRDENASDRDVEEAFRRDASLSYKLLRIASNVAPGGQGVDSIRGALGVVGRAPLQRWLSLLLASSFSGVDGRDLELVNAALLRARFCELLGQRAEDFDRSESLFLIGLFSLMDAVLRLPMREVLARVDLSGPVKAALLERAGPCADLLLLAEAYEQGDWDEVMAAARRSGIPPVEVPEIYLLALQWARDQVSAAA
jgi:c-di-GMP phosphodiesterase